MRCTRSRDDSAPHILEEIARDGATSGPGRDRHVHLVLENDDNAARCLARDADGAARRYTAQWNDDVHHALHVLPDRRDATATTSTTPTRPLKHARPRARPRASPTRARSSPHRGGRARGEPTAALPLTAFVSFLQNHDQIGNRAFGERLTVLAEPPSAAPRRSRSCCSRLRRRCCSWARNSARPRRSCSSATSSRELAAAVRDGRRASSHVRALRRCSRRARRFPIRRRPATFARAKLDWESSTTARARELRSTAIASCWGQARGRDPDAAKLDPRRCGFAITGPRSLAAHWSTDDGSRLLLFANSGRRT